MIVKMSANKLQRKERRKMELKTFGDRVFWARRHARLTQQQLRDKMQEEYGEDIGRNYISQMETEGAQPVFSVARALAGALGVSLDFLAGFTDNYTAVSSEESTPVYFSPEADEAAKLVDAMHPSQRQLLLNLARSMNNAPTLRQLERAEIRDILDSVERDQGVPARKQLEQLFRDKGIPVDPDS